MSLLKDGVGVPSPCSNHNFIRINYQGLVDYVIAPNLKNVGSDKGRLFLEDYLLCLSKNVRKDVAMAFSAEEKELFRGLWNKNQDLFLAMMTALREDSEVDDDVREQMEKTVKCIRDASERDTSKYKLDGAEGVFNKGKLAFAVVQMYCDRHPEITYEGLKEIFPSKGAKHIIEKKENVKDAKRFSRSSILLENGIEVVVSTQWVGGKGENFEAFLTRAENLNFKVTKV